MAGQAKRATELRELAELVADTLTEWSALQRMAEPTASPNPAEHYQPTIPDAAMAAAFDLAMARSLCPVRASRGSPCAVDFNTFGHVCQRARGHAGPHYADFRGRPALAALARMGAV